MIISQSSIHSIHAELCIKLKHIITLRKISLHQLLIRGIILFLHYWFWMPIYFLHMQ